MKFPMQHPPYVIREMSFEKYVQDYLLKWTLGYRIRRKAKKLLEGDKKH